MKKYFQAPWTIKEVLIVLIAAILLVGTTVLISNFLSLEAIKDSPNKSYYVLLGLFIQWFLILAPLVIVTAKKHGLKFSHFGTEKIPFWKGFWKVIEAYFLFIAISIIISILIIYLGIEIPGYQVQEDILPLFGDGTADMIIAGILIVLLAPVIEEFFFRGFLLRALSDKVGIYYGSLITAFLFAIFHFQWQSIIPIFILSLIINALVIRTKSIYPAIGFHILNNGISFIAQILLSSKIISIENVV